ncbi:MAG: ABC transporter substrate-binding protein [Alphaproteobacteria bacterium]|nr:ABC transporter substrate-binding protein [Alphaproteobacteria bacterium]
MSLERITRRRVLAGAAALTAAGAALGALAQSKPARIVVNASGGAQAAALRKAFFEAYEQKFGIRVVDSSPPDLGKLKAMVTTGNVEWAITELAIEDAYRAEKEGLLEPIDHKIVDLSRFPDHLKTRKHIFTRSAYSTVIGYRTDSWPAGKGPQNWADFWDVRRFPGPRTMQNKPLDNIEFALLADGVPIDKLYPLDVDRAFRKLDQLKKSVTVWWATGAQSAQLLIDKECVLGTAWNGRYYAAIQQGAPIHMEWNQGGIKESAFVIPKGAKDAHWAQQMFQVMTDAKLQGIYANIVTYPGLNLDSPQYVEAKIAPHLPTAKENIGRQFWQDVEWWIANGKAVEDRWSKWLIT